MTDTQKTELCYSDADLEAMVNARRTFTLCKEGWIKGVVKGTKTRECESGSKEVTLLITPLGENDTPISGMSIPFKLYLPFPGANGKAAPNTFDQCKPLARLLDPKGVQYSKKGDGNRRIMPDGSIVDKEVAFNHDKQVDLKVYKMAASWWDNPEQFKDEVLYAEVRHEVSKKDGKTYQKVGFISVNPPKTKEGDLKPVRTTDFGC
jgi:hypothetical protein